MLEEIQRKAVDTATRRYNGHQLMYDFTTRQINFNSIQFNSMIVSVSRY